MAVVLVTPLARQDLGDVGDYAAESSVERAELDEYERLEHLMILIKSGSLRHPAGVR